MDFFKEEIFQQLISDPHFIQWARGKAVEDESYWNNWKINHPEDASTFDEALAMVQDLTFQEPAISDDEIRYLWNQVDNRIQEKQQENLAQRRRIYIWMRAAAACLIAGLLSYTVWLTIDNIRIKSAYAHISDNLNNQMVSVQAPLGTRAEVDLPDGSKVWLNAGSRLSYPALFQDNERRVHLDGEGFFKVQKGKVPFIVENAGPEVKVYGTSFNVNAYANENLVTVALIEGKVSLKTAGSEQFLKPDQVSYFNKTTKTLAIKEEQLDRFVCWRDGKFIFRNTPIEAILRMLQREYNVSIDMKDPSLGNYRYNATFQNENLEQILQLLEFSAPVKCEYKKGRFTDNGSYVTGQVHIYLDKTRNLKL
jgi:ferric-dicitrate binding protein FerR (iron transport regulator)